MFLSLWEKETAGNCQKITEKVPEKYQENNSKGTPDLPNTNQRSIERYQKSTGKVEGKYMYTIIYEHNKHLQMLIYS